MFTVIWYNPNKHLYDYFYKPTNYLIPTKARLISNSNTNNYIDTLISVSQLHSYLNGNDLVDNIFNEEVSNWIKEINKTTNYVKYKHLVDKVQIT